MSTESKLEEAMKHLTGTVGEITLCLVCRRGLSSRRLRRWIYRLRTAADALEEMIP